MTGDLETLRRHLAAGLPARVRAALEGYERFAADEPPADAKGFAAWHAAAKAALAHVEVLVKLARWAEADGPAPGEGGVEALLAKARAEMADYDDEREDDDP